jgi:hypothetical protein
MPHVKRFARYANQVERLVVSAASEPLSQERKKQIARALDGEPAAKLKQLESIERLRQSGAFFTSPALAKQLVRSLIPRLVNGVSVHDFACGTGNLLTACAYHLPTSGDLQQTLKLWGEYLGGNDIHEEFVRVAKARLALVAIDRGVTGKAPEPEDIFPRVRAADAFDQAPLADPQCITLNPPFTMTVAPTDCTWASGQVSNAALMLEACVLNAKPGTQVVAILPEVLRTGSHYERWRHVIERAATIESVEIVGLFDKSTDIDVFIVRLTVSDSGETAKGSWWRSDRTEDIRKTTISDLFDVRVGPVVPHRDPHKGQWYPYVTAHHLPAWATVNTDTGFAHRRFSGTTYIPPILLVRRTSRPGENHLLVLKPKDRLLRTCRSAIQRLGRTKADTWLNERIRCRHLTVQSIKEMPW